MSNEQCNKEISFGEKLKASDINSKLLHYEQKTGIFGNAGSWEIIQRLFFGSGPSILYSLSVLSVIYGLVGILTPLFCIEDVLGDKLICIGTMQGYEILLLIAAIIPFVKKKITNDSVSLIIFIAMFLVVGAITLDTISVEGFTLSALIGLLWLIIGIGKILVMKNSLKIKFPALFSIGLIVLIAWNYLVSPIMAKYLLSIAPTSTNIPLDMREFWRMCWLLFICSISIIWYFSVSSGNKKPPEESGIKHSFLQSAGMSWIFIGILFLASMYHQRVLCYVYDIRFYAGDFLPAIIIVIFIVAELLWNYRLEFLAKNIQDPHQKELQPDDSFKNDQIKFNILNASWLKLSYKVELILFSMPLLLIFIIISCRNGFVATGYLSDIFWNPLFLLGTSSAILLHDWLRYKRSYLIYPLMGNLVGIVLLAGVTPGVPENFNWRLTGLVLMLALMVIGFIRKNIFLAAIGLSMAVIGVFHLLATSSLINSRDLNRIPSMITLGGIIILLFYLSFKERFPRCLGILAAFAVSACIMFCYDGHSGLIAYRIIAAICCAALGVGITFRVNDLPTGLFMTFPLTIYALLNIRKMNHWHYVLLGFILLAAGTLFSVYKDYIGRKIKDLYGRYKTKFIKKGKGDSYYMLFFITAVVAVLFAMLVPNLNIARETARKISCTGNLKQIGLALRMYSNVYGEAFPNLDGAEGLEMLRKEGFLENLQCYKCPSTDGRCDRNAEKLTEDNVSYCYRGGLTEASSVGKALAWDKADNHDQYGNILFVDGHVKGYAGANWMDNIK